MKLNKSYYSKKDGVMLEKGIQREICDWLHSCGFFFWRSNNAPIFGRSNDGRQRFRALPKYTPRGLPDIIMIYNGKFVAFEVKRPDQKLRPEQAEFGSKCFLNGGFYRRVTSLSEVKSYLIDVIAIKP